MSTYKERCEQFANAVKTSFVVYLDGEQVEDVKEARATDSESGQAGDIVLNDGTKLYGEVRILPRGKN